MKFKEAHIVLKSTDGPKTEAEWRQQIKYMIGTDGLVFREKKLIFKEKR